MSGRAALALAFASGCLAHCARHRQAAVMLAAQSDSGAAISAGLAPQPNLRVGKALRTPTIARINREARWPVSPPSLLTVSRPPPALYLATREVETCFAAVTLAALVVQLSCQRSQPEGLGRFCTHPPYTVGKTGGVSTENAFSRPRADAFRPMFTGL